MPSPESQLSSQGTHSPEDEIVHEADLQQTVYGLQIANAKETMLPAEVKAQVPQEYLDIMLPALQQAQTDKSRKLAQQGKQVMQGFLAKNEALERAEIDPVTGLYNRNVFERDIASIVKRHTQGAVLLIGDLNGLKRVNDALGHQGGDSYLKAEADSAQTDKRPLDKWYRLGGDEIAGLIQGVEGDVERSIASIIARKKEAAQSAAERVGIPAELYVGLSMGGAALAPTMGVNEWFAIADQHLQADKQAFNASIPREVLQQDQRRI